MLLCRLTDTSISHRSYIKSVSLGTIQILFLFLGHVPIVSNVAERGSVWLSVAQCNVAQSALMSLDILGRCSPRTAKVRNLLKFFDLVSGKIRNETRFDFRMGKPEKPKVKNKQERQEELPWDLFDRCFLPVIFSHASAVILSTVFNTLYISQVSSFTLFLLFVIVSLAGVIFYHNLKVSLSGRSRSDRQEATATRLGGGKK